MAVTREAFLRLLLLMIVFSSATAHAETAPVPRSKAQALDSVQQNLEDEKRREGETKKQLDSIKSELDGTRASLVTLADEIRENEKNLTLIEDRITALTEEEKILTERLEQEYSSIADLILALERMRRIPPESLIVRPGAPLQTAQSAMLLGSTLPAVDKRAAQLSTDLRRLSDVTLDLQKNKTEALANQIALGEKQKSLHALINKREKLYSSTQSDYARHKATVERLSHEARTLMDLLSRLEEHEEQRQKEPEARKIAQIYGSGVPDSGAARLPVEGTVIEAFGQANTIGATSQGLTVEARPGTLVVAPMGGVVRFAGTFKNYGNMVIIEHKGGYHSLIAGLHHIDTAEESRVKAGEPIGQLPLTSSRGGRPALYYELRHKGQPVNPAERFSDLKS